MKLSLSRNGLILDVQLTTLRPRYRDLLRMSILLVLRNRRRYRSVIVAVACGVAGLIVVVNIGDSVEQEMGRHLTILGRSTIVDVEMVEDGSRHPGSFTDEDVDALGRIPHVMVVAPHVSLGNFEAGFYQESMVVTVTGVHYAFWSTIMASVLEGSLTNASHEHSKAPVCVLGSTLVETLFQGTDPVGKHILLGGMSCVVIGTLGGIQGLDSRNTAFIPLSTARHRLQGLYDLKAIRLRADHWGNVPAIATKVAEILRAHHRIHTARSIRVYYYPDRIQKVQDTVTMVRILAVLASAVTVLIGGGGVAMLMLAAVRDRRREIGLRKALGAQDPDILLQFLFEAVIVSCRGGIAGIIAGFICCLGLQFMLGTAMSVPIFALSIPLAMVGAVTLGLVAGIYPAMLACAADPVTSMREE
ncbi:MAG: ABC transporter permease [Desulfomonilaceae bacterium]|nr:ABC transporter permease [Desulfomonilaceae bacterium]